MAKANKFLFSLLCSSLLCSAAGAKEIDMNTAQMQAMDKITGRVSLIDVPVNGEVKFGSFSIVVRACKSRPPEETPENYAFVDVADETLNGEQLNIFKGWMLSSTPALNAVEHPIYDVWLLKCTNTSVDKSRLLSPEQLTLRDEMPKKAPDKENTIQAPLSEEVPAAVSDKNVPETELSAEPVIETNQVETVVETQKVLEVTEPVAEEENILEENVEDGAPTSLINLPIDAAGQTENASPEVSAEMPIKAEVVESTGKEADKTAELAIEHNVAAVEDIPIVEVPEETPAEPLLPTETDNIPSEDDQFIDLSSEAGDFEAPETDELKVEALTAD